MRKNLLFSGKSALRVGTLVIAGVLTFSAALMPGSVAIYAGSDSEAIKNNESAYPTESGVSQIPGTITTKSSYNSSFLSVTGFASVEGNIHDRSEYVGTEYYRVINDEKEFLDAIRDAQKGQVKVMEITKDMDLGYQYLSDLLTSSVLRKYNFVRKYKKPSNELANVNGGFTNPLMAKSDVTQISLSGIDGLTIFSTNGSSIKHTELKISSNDIVIRNLKFKEMWQWDDAGAQKEVGWTNIKINGGKNVWIDHCTFEIASDGNIDIENGSNGITISWCKIGDEATETPSEDSSIYQSIMFMEERYQKGELNPEKSLYYQMRTAGATPGQIMAYSAYHKKCHLSGSGDKDFVNYVRPDGEVVEDANSNINLTLCYNHYVNVGQRVPMIRQGVGNLINCYIDDSTHQTAAEANPVFEEIGPYHLSRCLNSRNGACIAADTCVFNGIEEPITGAEIQGDDPKNMQPEWAVMFQNAYNHVLIVNSEVTNSKGTYTGSSWDNNGENLFTTGFDWKDKSTIGNWAWASHIVNEQSYEKRDYTLEEATPMEFTYETEGVLPFSYQVLPLEDVKEVVTGNSGAGAIDMTSSDWLKIKYLAEADYSEVDAEIAKARSLTPSDYEDFSGVTDAINEVERGFMSDNQEKVDAMATDIENAIFALVKIKKEENLNEVSLEVAADTAVVTDEAVKVESSETAKSPTTGDNNMSINYLLMTIMSVSLIGIEVLFRKNRQYKKFK